MAYAWLRWPTALLVEGVLDFAWGGVSAIIC